MIALGTLAAFAPTATADHGTCGGSDVTVASTVKLWTSTAPDDCAGASLSRPNIACVDGLDQSVDVPDLTVVDGVTVVAFHGVPCTLAGAWVHFQAQP